MGPTAALKADDLSEGIASHDKIFMSTDNETAISYWA